LAWQQSGLTQAEYCRQHNIRDQRLIYWRNQLKHSPTIFSKTQFPDKHFIEAAITGGEPAIVVKLRGGEQLEIEDPQRVDATWLIQLVLGLSAGVRP
jgi:hypothetical protein